MRLPCFNLSTPSTVEEALSVLAELEGSGVPLAGGTDLIPVIKFGLQTPSTVVGLKKVGGLKEISQENGKVSIGAMTPLVDILSSPATADNFPGLIQAVNAVAAPPIWNVATIGGNICQNSRCLYYNQSKIWRLERGACLKAHGNVCHAVPKGKKCFSVYSGDLAPVLIALGAKVTLRSTKGSRSIHVQDLFSGDGLVPLTLAKEELLTGVEVPLPSKRSSSSYVKMRVRSSVDYPLLSAAVSMSCTAGGKIESVRLVLGAAGPNPVAATNVDQFFTGKTVDEIDFDGLGESIVKVTRMVDNLMLPGSYRRKMAPVLAREAVKAAYASIRKQENS